MSRKNTVIRSTSANTVDASARYVTYAPDKAMSLVSLADAQRFTPKEAREHVASMVASGEWMRGQFRCIPVVDAKLLRDWNPGPGANWK